MIRQAVDEGVNLLDTAEAYGTEHIVGKAIAQIPRDRVVISTKKTLPSIGHPDPGKEIKESLEQSLKQLGTDYVDIYHLHGVEPKDYPYAKNRLLPFLLELREQGKIRFVGITEGFVPDPAHRMLQQALKDDDWDVVMVGFNILNPSARQVVFPNTIERNVGVLNMFAVRRGLSQPKRFADIVTDLSHKGLLETDPGSPTELLDLLISDGIAATLPEAAYRFCRHEPGVHVVLTGTGNPEHLRENLQSLTKPPLPQPVLDRLRRIFGNVDSISGN